MYITVWWVEWYQELSIEDTSSSHVGDNLCIPWRCRVSDIYREVLMLYYQYFFVYNINKKSEFLTLHDKDCINNISRESYEIQ